MSINLTLFAQIVTFAAFIWFCARFIWPPLNRAIETRQKQIADGLAAAERGKLDMEQAAKRTADMLHEARQQTQEILAQANRGRASSPTLDNLGEFIFVDYIRNRRKKFGAP